MTTKGRFCKHISRRPLFLEILYVKYNQAKSISQTRESGEVAMKCWEFTKCGRDHKGGCPAWPDNGTRCAEVAGTFCEDKSKVLGVNAIKLKDCRKCEFFNSDNYEGDRDEVT